MRPIDVVNKSRDVLDSDEIKLAKKNLYSARRSKQIRKGVEKSDDAMDTERTAGLKSLEEMLTGKIPSLHGPKHTKNDKGGSG